MKAAIIGAGGMLATDVIEVFNESGIETVALSIDNLDITRLEDVLRLLRELKPDLVFNAAAYTNVDGCESEQELAYKVNAIGPRNLAIACEDLGAALVQISTDYVFGGRGGSSAKPFREYDPVAPQSVYGKTKLDGEIMVRAHCTRHFIVRTAWLFGQHGPNFVRTMLRLSGERDSISVVNDQLGSPTYTRDLAEALSELVQTKGYGTYHLTNSDYCTWFEFTQEILRQAGITKVSVEPQTTEQLNRAADRPRYSVLENYIWTLDGHKPLRSYKEALADYLSRENSKA